MIVGNKQITEAFWDEEHQTWAAQVSLIWKGDFKEGTHEITSLLYGAVTNYSMWEIKGSSEAEWYIGGSVYAEVRDTFALDVIKNLLAEGWKWA